MRPTAVLAVALAALLAAADGSAKEKKPAEAPSGYLLEVLHTGHFVDVYLNKVLVFEDPDDFAILKANITPFLKNGANTLSLIWKNTR